MPIRTFSLIIVLVLIDQATACPVCMQLPIETVADQLIDAEVVTFSREDPREPFTFISCEVLKGELSDPHIELFADSSTRHRLNSDESRFVILVKEGTGWKNLGVADKEYQKVVRRILVFSSEWKGTKGNQKRLEYFLSLWGHENRAIFELAYLELGRMPYSSIKQFAKLIPDDDLQPMLTDRNYLEWRSLAILMLAQREDEKAQSFIDESFENCAKFSLTTNLGAWTTAYVELHGARGVDVIEQRYLLNSERSVNELRTVLTALSIHGQQDDAELRERIIESYGSVLKVHPHLVDRVVNDLTMWKEHRYDDTVVDIQSHSNSDSH